MYDLAKDFSVGYLKVINNSDILTLSLARLMFRVTVACDAFHPMAPDLCQGGCAALEDPVVLVRSNVNMTDNVAKGIRQFVIERRVWLA